MSRDPMTDPDDLAADIARLDLDPDVIALETASCERLIADGKATPDDLTYRGALEKRAARTARRSR